MQKQIMKKLLVAFAALVAVWASEVRATVILTVGNIPQAGDENVLLNTGLSGNPIFGTTNQTGLSVQFGSNETLTAPASGQARVEAVDGFFTTLTTSLPGASFTSLILNLDASADGFVNFVATEPNGQVTNFNSFAVTGSGSNFFTFTTIDGQRLASVALTSTAPISFTDAAQIRIGGAQRNVPDGGATVAMLGLGLVGLFGLRRRLSA
jgi:hypothetical protein